MTDPVLQGVYWLTVIVLSGVLVSFVLLLCGLARAMWQDRAERRAARRRHPSYTDVLIDPDVQAWRDICKHEGWRS